MKAWEAGAKAQWALLAWLLIGMPLLALGAVKAWPFLHGWLTSKAPWWFLPTVAFVGFFVIVLAAMWRDLFPRKWP